MSGVVQVSKSHKTVRFFHKTLDLQPRTVPSGGFCKVPAKTTSTKPQKETKQHAFLDRFFQAPCYQITPWPTCYQKSMRCKLVQVFTNCVHVHYTYSNSPQGLDKGKKHKNDERES